MKILRNPYLKCICVCVLSLLTFCGCVTHPPSTTGTLGFENSRRVVIIGENVDGAYAVYYQRKYDALVWFTPFQGKIVKNTSNFFQNGFGPSVAMKALIRELKSINYTVGKWEIIVPPMGQRYFLAALKYMKDGELAKARGVVVLSGVTGFPDIERELLRVTRNTFFVVYEDER